MKTPFQGDTRGIMMSGDSPSPNGLDLNELETVTINQPVSLKITVDQAVQFNSADNIGNSVVNCSSTPHQNFASEQPRSGLEPSTFAALRMNDEQDLAELEEEISNGDEISSLCTSAVKVKSDDSAMRSEDIETVTDQTDNPSTPKNSVNQQQEDESCLIKCLFYIDECCTCTIL